MVLSLSECVQGILALWCRAVFCTENVQIQHKAQKKAGDEVQRRDTMKKYLTGMKRKVERDGNNETNESHPKAKTRKYDEAYVALGFTVTTVGDEERPAHCL